MTRRLLMIGMGLVLVGGAPGARGQSEDIFRQIHLERIEQVRGLVENDPYILNAREPVTERSPLMVAAENGSLEIVKYLVSKGAELDKEDKDRNPAIRLAALKNHKRTSPTTCSAPAPSRSS